MKPACPQGCDRRFLQFVLWRGESCRVGQGNYSSVDGHQWSGLLRCADCNDTIIVVRISKADKDELEAMIVAGKDEMERMLEDIDQHIDQRKAEFRNYLKETGRL